MHTKQIPYVPQFVYLGAQGLRGGGNGAAEASGSGEPQEEPAAGEPQGAQGREPSQPLAAQGHESSLVALQKRMAQGDITSTAALVKAFNAAQPAEQPALQQWVQRYIDWFSKEAVGSLTPEDMQAYRSLAHIQADTGEKKKLLKEYFNNLCNQVDEKYQHGEEPLLEALEYTLQTLVEYTLQNDDSHVFGKLLLKLDPSSDVFEGASNPLIQLGNKLLAKLDPGSNQFTKATYPTHRSTLYALHQTLVLIKLIDSGQVGPRSRRRSLSATPREV